jgi:hypothetical protein
MYVLRKPFKGSLTRDFLLHVFSQIGSPWATEYTTGAALNFYNNSRRYLQLCVYRTDDKLFTGVEKPGDIMFTNVKNTGDKLFTGVKKTGDKMLTGVKNTGDKFLLVLLLLAIN